MKLWTPRSSEPVGKSEKVARRIFDEPVLAGLEGKNKRYDGLDLRNFEETRDREFSLDRLGRGTIEPPVVAYLLPRARAAGQKLHKPVPFNGWVVLAVKQLEDPPKGKKYKMPVIASAIPGDGVNDLTENKFHAHAALPELDSYDIALHLRNLFTRYGDTYPVETIESLPSPFWHRFLPAWAWLESRLQGWLSTKPE